MIGGIDPPAPVFLGRFDKAPLNRPQLKGHAMSDTPKDAKDIFLAAIEIADPAERAAFVERSCVGDAALRQRVEDLLRAYGQSDGPLDKLAAALASTEMAEPIREQVGATIGPYKLMEQIGEGGFGLVFVAEQERPIRRKVALKIIKPGMDTRDVIARFEAERQALALMDHPNIARVLDAGTTESGRPYFVMELVRGVPITNYCDQAQLTPRERLELFVAVCNAVQHAHQKGIIHRDLKPSNLLVTLHDGQPVVKVIDFGVAKALHQKLTDRTIYTRFAQMIGTPLYMSPEQAEMSGLEIDTRTDVYSLGVLLYELLTGSTPFDKRRLAKAAYDELLKIIRDEEPPKPSTRLSQSTESLPAIAAQRRTDPAKLSKMFRGDLDWITMKALEKDRTRRYGSARELAEDIERYERGDPIVAKSPTLRYLLGKYVRRNRLQIGTAAAIFAAVIAGTVFEFYRIDRDRREAIKSRHEAVEARAAAESAREQALLREQEAHQQKERAEVALKDAEQQRKLAEENFRQTRQAVDKYFTLISESRLIDIPGAEPLRKELLNAALEYYQKYDQKFPKLESDNAELQAELAAAHLRMSQIQYFTGAGDWLSESEKGYDIVERLLAGKTPIEKFKSLEAGVTDVAGRPPQQGFTAQPSRALKIFQRGARLWEQLVAARPSSIGFRNDLATTLLIIGHLKVAIGGAMGDGGSSLLDEGLRSCKGSGSLASPVDGTSRGSSVSGGPGAADDKRCRCNESQEKVFGISGAATEGKGTLLGVIEGISRRSPISQRIGLRVQLAYVRASRDRQPAGCRRSNAELAGRRRGNGRRFSHGPGLQTDAAHHLQQPGECAAMEAFVLGCEPG